MASINQQYREVAFSVRFHYRLSCVNLLPNEIRLQESSLLFLEVARSSCASTVRCVSMFNLDGRMQASAGWKPVIGGVSESATGRLGFSRLNLETDFQHGIIYNVRLPRRRLRVGSLRCGGPLLRGKMKEGIYWLLFKTQPERAKTTMTGPS